MRIGIPKERRPGETRVAATPETVKKLVKAGHEVLVEREAGVASDITDAAYEEAGAQIVDTAGAFGADGVVIGERRSVGVNATVWKVSAGAAARVPVARETNLVRALERLKKEGCFVVGLDGRSEGAVDDLALADSPLVLVAGAEGAGLSRLVRQTCDEVVSIPIRRTVESLNAAVAAGIGLYEVDRLRRRARSGRD